MVICGSAEGKSAFYSLSDQCCTVGWEREYWDWCDWVDKSHTSIMPLILKDSFIQKEKGMHINNNRQSLI